MPLTRKIKFLTWEEWSHILKLHSIAYILWLKAVDLIHSDQWEVFLTLLWWMDHSADSITRLKTKVLNLRWRNIDIIWRIQIVVICRAKESVSIRHNLQHSLADNLTSKGLAFRLTLNIISARLTRRRLLWLLTCWLRRLFFYCRLYLCRFHTTLYRHSCSLLCFTLLLLLQSLGLTTSTLGLGSLHRSNLLLHLCSNTLHNLGLRSYLCNRLSLL